MTDATKTVRSRVYKRINYLSWYILNLKMYVYDCTEKEDSEKLLGEVSFREAELEGLLDIIGEHESKTAYEKSIVQRELNGEVSLHVTLKDCCKHNQMNKSKIYGYLNRKGVARIFYLDYITPEYALNYEI